MEAQCEMSRKSRGEMRPRLTRLQFKTRKRLHLKNNEINDSGGRLCWVLSPRVAEKWQKLITVSQWENEV